MTDQQPDQIPPTVPDPPQRPPLINRVAELERQLAILRDLHNRFTDDVTRELGL